MKKMILRPYGFAVVELLAVVFVIAVVAGGYFVVTSSINVSNSKTVPSTVLTVTPVPTVGESVVGEFEVVADPKSTPLPTVVPIESTSSDSEIKELSQDINVLLSDVNELDTIDSDLDLPEVDFSLNF